MTAPGSRQPGLYTRGQNLLAIRRGSDPARAHETDVVANDDRRYAYVPDQPISLDSTRPFRSVFQRFLETDGVLGPVETQQVRDIIARIDAIEASGAVDPDRDGDFFLGSLATLFLLSVNHPGPIPPPFPDGLTAASR